MSAGTYRKDKREAWPGGYALHKSISTAAPRVVLLQLDKLELAKRLKHGLQIVLCDVEVNVAHVQPVERYRVGVPAPGLGRPRLAVLLGLGDLDNDRDT